MRRFRSVYILVFPFLLLALTNCHNNNSTQAGESGMQNGDSLDTDSSQYQINKLTQKLELEPANADLLVKRATLYRARGKKMLALEDMKKAVQLQPVNYNYHLILGEIYFDLTDISQAIKTYEKCIAIDNEKDEAFLRLGRIYLYQAKPEETIGNINEALRRNKYNPEAYALKASYYLQMKDTTRAVSNLVTSTEVDPDYFKSYVDLGYLYALQTDFRAANYYANALRLQPGNTQVMYNLGKFLQDMAHFDSASTCYQQILEIEPAHKSANYNLGYIYFLKSNFEKAAGYFTTALTTSSTYTEAWLGRALCNDSLGNKEQAISDYRKVIELDANEKTAHAALSTLISGSQ